MRTNITISLDVELVKKLRKQANRWGGISNMIEKLLEKELKVR